MSMKSAFSSKSARATLFAMRPPQRTRILSQMSMRSSSPGDVMMTGTPAGVGPVAPGNHLVGDVEGLAPVSVTFTDPD